MKKKNVYTGNSRLCYVDLFHLKMQQTTQQIS